MNPEAAADEGMEKKEMQDDEDEGFDKQEFLLWVSRNQVLGLALAVAVAVDDKVLGYDYEAGFGGADGGVLLGTGFAEKSEKRCHYNCCCFGGDETGSSWTLKPLGSITRVQNQYQVSPLKT